MKSLAIVLGLTLSLCGAASASFTAFDSSSQTGNQQFSGSLGLDFNVVSPITLSALGAFVASNNNPAGLSTPVTVSIYNRSTGLVVASETISGSANSGMGGFDIVNLPSAVNLAAGFQGSIVVSGYSAAELDCNTGYNGTIFGNCTAPTENSGSGLISFVGSGRYGAAGVYPTTLDSGPANRYDAGTFVFSAQAVGQGTVPEPATLSLISLGLLGLGATRLRKRNS